MTTFLLTPKRRYVCPHCALARTKLMQWRIGAIVGWLTLFVLITLCK